MKMYIKNTKKHHRISWQSAHQHTHSIIHTLMGGGQRQKDKKTNHTFTANECEQRKTDKKREAATTGHTQIIKESKQKRLQKANKK